MIDYMLNHRSCTSTIRSERVARCLFLSLRALQQKAPYKQGTSRIHAHSSDYRISTKQFSEYSLSNLILTFSSLRSYRIIIKLQN